METHVIALAWLIFIRREYKLWRMLCGGLWVNFEGQGWMTFKWMTSPGYPKQYIVHPQGGSFSIKFKGIIAIENYSWGHTK